MCAVTNVRPAALAGSARMISLLVWLACASSWAHAAQESAATCSNASAKLPLMTNEEAAKPDCRTNPLDAIQFIPLGDNENHYLSFGFWIRERGEYVSNPNWSDTPPGNGYLMQRYGPHPYLHFGKRFRFFGELATSLLNGRNGGPRPGLDEEEKMYVHQGFFDLGLWKSGRDSRRYGQGGKRLRSDHKILFRLEMAATSGGASMVSASHGSSKTGLLT